MLPAQRCHRPSQIGNVLRLPCQGQGGRQRTARKRFKKGSFEELQYRQSPKGVCHMLRTKLFHFVSRLTGNLSNEGHVVVGQACKSPQSICKVLRVKLM